MWLWVADATRVPCGEGVFWLAAVRDAFSNRIGGWRCSDRCDTDLILGALEYGIWTRDVRDGQLIHHSDYASVCVKPRIRGMACAGRVAGLVPRLNDGRSSEAVEGLTPVLGEPWRGRRIDRRGGCLPGLSHHVAGGEGGGFATFAVRCRDRWELSARHSGHRGWPERLVHKVSASVLFNLSARCASIAVDGNHHEEQCGGDRERREWAQERE
jgi:hypothetical protein